MTYYLDLVLATLSTARVLDNDQMWTYTLSLLHGDPSGPLEKEIEPCSGCPTLKRGNPLGFTLLSMAAFEEERETTSDQVSDKERRMKSRA